MCFVEAIGEATMNGYYVDEWTGLVCSTAAAPSGCHFEFKDKRGFREVWIVADQSGEVLLQAVFWDSLEALAAAIHHETDCMDAAKVK
jgi:hypothetical protein